jgi:hypothetical protein
MRLPSALPSRFFWRRFLDDARLGWQVTSAQIEGGNVAAFAHDFDRVAGFNLVVEPVGLAGASQGRG